MKAYARRIDAQRRNRLPERQVAGRPGVRAREMAGEEPFRRPDADAADGDKATARNGADALGLLTVWHPEHVAQNTTGSVLVVEDEASIASFVSLYLKNAGYAVKTASTGKG